MNLTVFMCIVWTITILYGEMFAFWIPSLSSCSWPHLSTVDRAGNLSEYLKVVVIADPQLMDRTTHGLAPNSLALEIVQFYTDLYMRRAFVASVLPFNPDAILFVGDYFDGGPFLSNAEWQASLNRFKHIFDLNTRRRTSSIPVYYIPGNHDIGYENSHRPEVIKRYEGEFGSRNYQFTKGKLKFIAVDAQTLDGHPGKNLTSASWEFVKNVSMDDGSRPTVLLTHIPLYRPDSTPCGPHRTSEVINQRVSRGGLGQSIGYQNYVTEESSDRLLDLIKPVLVLSGHDHDQCTVTHMSKSGPILEHTLGTISWQQGNLYPSFMLLSASSNASTHEDTVSTNLCFLPMQTHIYVWYFSLLVITLLVLVLQPTNNVVLRSHFNDAIGCIGRILHSIRVNTKEKVDDDENDYEVMWDAEGSMHLVKKPMKVTPTHQSDNSFAERGNAVIRPAAKKQSAEEAVLPMTTAVGLDGTVKLPARTSKSKRKLVIQRLIKTIRALTVIAAVNVPLYMMLLFKDWIN